MCALRSAGIAFGSFRLSITNQRVECRHAVSTWRRKWRSPALGGHFVRQIRRTVADSLLLHLSLTQLQFLLIQRIKRSLRIFELYCTLYERDALRALARSYGRRLADRARWSLLGVPLVTNSNNNNSNNTSNNKNDNSGGDRSQHDGGYEQSSWKESSSNVSAAAAAAGADKNGHSGGDSRNDQASSSVSHGYENEFDEFRDLLLNSVYCAECQCRQLIDQKVSGVDYCRCINGEPTAAVNRLPASSWVPFLEKRDTIVWRRQHEQHRHLYVYKVYGSFSDISADAFCEVQLNTEYRRVWDNSVEQLCVIDPPTEVNDLKVTDPKANDSKINDHNVIGTKVNDPEVNDPEVMAGSSSSHALSGVAVIYWLVRFPRMFSNRDYVFERRHYRDDVTTTSSSSVRGESGASPGQLTIVSRAVADDWADLYCPRPAGVVRVSDYWSVMVVRPHTTFDKPGMDYGLTYFDDPGTQLPTFVTSYVTASGLPDFLERVAEAARKIQHQLSTDSLSIKPQYLPYRSLSDNVSPHSAAFSSSTSSSCYSASSNSSPLSSSPSSPSSCDSSSSNSSPLSSPPSSSSSDNSSNSNNSTGVTESPKLSARGRISAIS